MCVEISRTAVISSVPLPDFFHACHFLMNDKSATRILTGVNNINCTVNKLKLRLSRNLCRAVISEIRYIITFSLSAGIRLN